MPSIARQSSTFRRDGSTCRVARAVEPVGRPNTPRTMLRATAPRRNARARSFCECRALPRRPKNARAEILDDQGGGFREMVVAANRIRMHVSAGLSPTLDRDDYAGGGRLRRWQWSVRAMRPPTRSIGRLVLCRVNRAPIPAGELAGRGMEGRRGTAAHLDIVAALGVAGAGGQQQTAESHRDGGSPDSRRRDELNHLRTPGQCRRLQCSRR